MTSEETEALRTVCRLAADHLHNMRRSIESFATQVKSSNDPGNRAVLRAMRATHLEYEDCLRMVQALLNNKAAK